VDPRDHVALAGAIVELLQDVELQRVYGAAARRRAAELSWPAMARGVDSAVDAVQNGAG
jgi:glycosyltransferase involved in cell wall biosynthesis